VLTWRVPIACHGHEQALVHESSISPRFQQGFTAISDPFQQAFSAATVS
jgi:hypothetical protein